MQPTPVCRHCGYVFQSAKPKGLMSNPWIALAVLAVSLFGFVFPLAFAILLAVLLVDGFMVPCADCGRYISRAPRERA